MNYHNVQIVLRYRLSRDAGVGYKVYAIILHDEEIKVVIFGNETVIILTMIFTYNIE